MLMFFLYLKISIIYFIDIIRKFNSKVTGFSTGTGGQTAANANFNVAKAGAVSS